MSDTDAILESIACRAQGLYTLPAVAMKVLELTDHPKVDVPALKACIENDPALTIKVLRVVNSSLFGLSREVSDLNQALALLGIKPLKLLVLGFSLPDRLFADVAATQLDRYWRMALTKSVAAREISESFWHQAGDDAFVGGLLQDIGLLVLLRELGEPYVSFLDSVAEDGADLRAAEAEALQFDHTKLSARLLDAWGLPPALTRAIALPTKSGKQPQLPDSDDHLARIFQLADLVTQLVVGRRIGVLPDLLELGAAYCDLTKPQLTELVERLVAKVNQLAEVMSVKLPDEVDYRDVLVRAHERMSEVAEGAAEELIRDKQSEEEIYVRLLSESRALSSAAAQLTQRSESSPLSPAAVSATGAATSGANTEPDANIAAQRKQSIAQATQAPSGTDVHLLDRLSAMVMHCRAQRVEVSLLVVEIDAFDTLTDTHGAVGAQSMVGTLEALCQRIDHPTAVTTRIRDARLRIILPDCDRRQAVEYGRQLVRSVREMITAGAIDSEPIMTVSVGAATVALPPKNFQSQDLVEAAQRCLYGAQSCGGNSAKSIEIY